MEKGFLYELLKKNRSIGVVGNTNEGKTMLILGELIKLKKITKKDIYVYGTDTRLNNILLKNGIKILKNKKSLNKKYDYDNLEDNEGVIYNSIIYVDELGRFINPYNKNKHLKEMGEFFTDIHHNKNHFIGGTAEVNFWNKRLNAFMNCFIVKRINHNHLVNGTALLYNIKDIDSVGEQDELKLRKDEFYILDGRIISIPYKFEKNEELDSKSLIEDLL